MTPPVNPLFILSMPRSGSTLLQRLLANADHVATTAEPWIMLPLLDHLIATDQSGFDRYDGPTAEVAISEFVDRLGRGRLDLEEAVRVFATSLYSSASRPEDMYFVDKTPRYAAYVEELVSVFPDAHFILLQRDIREVLGSIMRTWGGGRWNIFLYTIDIVDGYDRLSSFALNPPQNCIVIDFADLVDDTVRTAARLSEFLGIDVKSELLSADDPKLEGSVGDRIGVTPGSRTGWVWDHATVVAS
jgi:hypothetical protein